MVIFPKIQIIVSIVNGKFSKIHFDGRSVKNAKERLRKQIKWCKVKKKLQEKFRLPIISENEWT